MRQFAFIHLPWIFMMIAITVQSSFASIPLPNLGLTFSDKVLHFLVFGVLGWFLARGLYLSKKYIFHRRFVIFACIIGFVFAFTDEWHQSMVPGRTPEFLDWVADSLGILTFAFIYYWQRKRTMRSPQ